MICYVIDFIEATAGVEPAYTDLQSIDSITKSTPRYSKITRYPPEAARFALQSMEV